MQTWAMTAHALARAIRQREVSCVEAICDSLARIEAVNPQVGAVAEVCAEEALHAARRADRVLAQGDTVAPLHGVPVTVKINVDQAGWATTNGVVAYKSVIAAHDSPVVANLRRAGAIVVGRSNTPAFSMRWFTDNDAHGRTLNPHDASITPGGSSGGAAAAVAVGMGAISHGNDQGGSIRYPAYACGVYGLRPSFGRVPAFNPSAAVERPTIVQLTSVQGPLARNVADLQLALQAMSARDVRDPWWVPAPLSEPDAHRPRRVALLDKLPGTAVEPAVTEALARAAKALERAGYEIEHACPPRFQEAADLWLTLTLGESRLLVEPALMRDADDAMRRAYRFMDHHAPRLDQPGLLRALASRSGLMRSWAGFFEDYPLLLMPTSWTEPFAADLDQRGEETMRGILQAQSALLSVAVLGLPGLSMPMGIRQGRPTGVQLVADRFREGLCLAAAEVIEADVGAVSVVDPRRT
jgi:amidase